MVLPVFRTGIRQNMQMLLYPLLSREHDWNSICRSMQPALTESHKLQVPQPIDVTTLFNVAETEDMRTKE
jgi:hypothetical protein